jgi:hypothetical protein
MFGDQSAKFPLSLSVFLHTLRNLPSLNLCMMIDNITNQEINSLTFYEKIPQGCVLGF